MTLVTTADLTDSARGKPGSGLGRLEQCDLREAWAHEATEFTPWLARPENLAILGDALGLQLEPVARERSVGLFQADLLCRDEDENWVLIENQLERTDHGHLGQALTYASGLDALTIIWIAARFTDEHRATFDWLNRITNDGFRFFGLEVELWRIENSLRAPKFNVVSQPNGWSRSMAHAARTIDDAELTNIRLMQRDYWMALNEVLDATGGPVAGNKRPQPRRLMSYPTGRSGFYLRAVMLRTKDQVRAELYVAARNAKSYFDLLLKHRDQIERELSYPLIWDEVADDQNSSRVFIQLDVADPEETDDWPRQHRWLADRLNDLHRVFAARIRTLGVVGLSPDPAG